MSVTTEYQNGSRILVVSTLMTWNDRARRNNPYFAFFFAEFDIFSKRLYHSARR